MKNKLLILLIIGIILPGAAYSKEISSEKALQTALSYYYGGAATRSGQNELKLLWDSNKLLPNTKSGTQAPSYYVFAPQTGNGFIIISGDDIIEPVLGYSYKYQAPQSNDMAPALKEWLEDICNYINNARENNYKDCLPTKSGSENATKAGTEVLLLKTVLWNQNRPFNTECPIDGDTQSLAGCNATAAGIIMHYHKWPDSGTGTTASYTTATKKINVHARNLAHKYNWDNMPDELKEGSYSDSQAKEIAVLLADIGASYSSDYSATETLAYFGTKPLFKFFKYDSGMSIIARSDFFKSKFDQILKRELHSLRPVLYSGRNSKNGGHAFVIDGYDSNDYFHINWGWGGNSNGYYAITEHSYNNGQNAYINIMPDKGRNNSPEYWVTLIMDGIKTDTGHFEKGCSFGLTATVNNHTVLEFNGFIRACIVNKAGKVKEWISNEASLKIACFDLLNNYYYYKQITLDCKITGNIEPGDRIQLQYRKRNDSNWYPVLPDPTSSTKHEIPIADSYTIRESTSIKFDKIKKVITVKFKDGVTASLNLNGTIVQEGIAIQANSMEIDANKLSDDTYILQLEKGAELEKVEISVKPLKNL